MSRHLPTSAWPTPAKRESPLLPLRMGRSLSLRPRPLPLRYSGVTAAPGDYLAPERQHVLSPRESTPRWLFIPDSDSPAQFAQTMASRPQTAIRDYGRNGKSYDLSAIDRPTLYRTEQVVVSVSAEARDCSWAPVASTRHPRPRALAFQKGVRLK
jgi:hypothetical protein